MLPYNLNHYISGLVGNISMKFSRKGKKSKDQPQKHYSDDIGRFVEAVVILAEKGEKLQKIIPSQEKTQKIFSLILNIFDNSKEKEGHTVKHRVKAALRDPRVLKEIGSLIRKDGSALEWESYSRFEQIQALYKQFGLSDTLEQYKGHWLKPKGEAVIKEIGNLIEHSQRKDTELPKIEGKDGRERVDASSIFFQYKDSNRIGHLNTSIEMFIRKRDLSGLPFVGKPGRPYDRFATLSLQNFSFDYATLGHCSFKDADLSHSSFRDALITGPVDFEGTIIDRKAAETLLPSIRKAQQNGIAITLNAQFIGDFTGLDFSGLNMSGADFSWARLDGVNFRNTIINGADIDPEQLARAANIVFIQQDTLSLGDGLGLASAIDIQLQGFAEVIVSRALDKAQHQAVENATSNPQGLKRENTHLSPTEHKHIVHIMGVHLKESIDEMAKTPQESQLAYATLMTDQALPIGRGGEYVKFSDLLAEKLKDEEIIEVETTTKKHPPRIVIKKLILSQYDEGSFKELVEETCGEFLRDFDRMTRFNPLAHAPARGALTPHDIMGEGGEVIPKGSMYVVPPPGTPTFLQLLQSDVASVIGGILTGTTIFLPKAAVKAMEIFQDWLDPSGRKIQSPEEREKIVKSFISQCAKQTEGWLDVVYERESSDHLKRRGRLTEHLTQKVLDKCSDLPALPEHLENDPQVFDRMMEIFVEYGLVKSSEKKTSVPKAKEKDPWLDHAADAITQVIRENSKGIYQEKILSERGDTTNFRGI